MVLIPIRNKKIVNFIYFICAAQLLICFLITVFNPELDRKTIMLLSAIFAVLVPGIIRREHLEYMVDETTHEDESTTTGNQNQP